MICWEGAVAIKAWLYGMGNDCWGPDSFDGVCGEYEEAWYGGMGGCLK